MKQCRSIVVMLLLSIASALKAEPIDNMMFLGLSIENNQRTGILDFGNDRIEELNKTSLWAAGFLAGKRWRLAPQFRVQASANIKVGTVVDDTLSAIMLSDSGLRETVIHETVFHGGGVLDFQYQFKVAPDGAWYVHAGGGGHVVSLSEIETLVGSAIRIIGDDYPENHLMYCASAHAGLGFEILASPRFGFAFSYSFRFWLPVHYGMRRDFFPVSPVDYYERFFTHEIDILLLARR